MSDHPHPPLVCVENLSVAYRQGKREWSALRDISLTLDAGGVYGLVGESGSGKTTLALAMMRYLPQEAEIQNGRIIFNGRDLVGLGEEEMRTMWGKELAYIPQDPGSSLNPALSIGEQIAEGIRIHQGLSEEDAKETILELFDQVRLPDPLRVASSYPHQISGGMQQRVLIAMALSAEPKLLILDEPTSNLDVTTQASVLALLKRLLSERRTTAFYVTHNMGVVAQFCDRVSVLYAGELVETGPTRALFDQPLHPYTSGLLNSIPILGENKQERPLKFMKGRAPQLTDPPSGCAFRSRCPLAIQVCEQNPPLYSTGESRASRCHRWEEIMREEVRINWPQDVVERVPERADEGAPTLTIKDLKVDFQVPRSLEQWFSGEQARTVEAVGGVDFEIPKRRTLGLVGESGSGKTTLARAVVGLLRIEEGEVRFMGKHLPAHLSRREIETLRQIQMIFQDPNESLNPYLTVGETLRRPIRKLRGIGRKAAHAEAIELLDSVHLSAAYARRVPSQLSGGEKQRVAIARAFASHPALLVADEPVSSLDVSVQSAILNLLNDLQAGYGGAYLFISHDLAVVGYFADIIAVMYLGKLMELASAGDLFLPPYHPYTEALISAIPHVDAISKVEPILLEGDIPSAETVPSGCPFHTRCPRSLGDLCRDVEPPWRVTQTGKRYYCHIDQADLLHLQTAHGSSANSGVNGET